MNALPMMKGAEGLPALVDRAAQALSSARTSAEVLEAKQRAGVAYDAAKSAGRIARAKQAHDDVIGAVYRAQADALLIEARAKARLADEYDVAQAGGEISKQGAHVADGNMRTSDLGLRRDEIHEARQIRDAEKAEPGLAERAVNAMVDAHQEPTKAELRRSVLAAVDKVKRKPSRKNPHRKRDAATDRVFKFSGLCRSLAEFDDIDEIAVWNRIPQTADKLPEKVRAAMRVLTRYMEIKDD